MKKSIEEYLIQLEEEYEEKKYSKNPFDFVHLLGCVESVLELTEDEDFKKRASKLGANCILRAFMRGLEE